MWSLTSERANAAARGELSPLHEITANQAVVATPDDIVALRASDPERAREWRQQLRSELIREFEAGLEIIGITDNGDYVLERINHVN